MGFSLERVRFRLGGVLRRSGRPLGSDRELKGVALRVPARLFTAVRAHVEDFTAGEQAGFLLCRRAARADGSLTLLAQEWIPISDEAKVHDDRSALAWTSAFTAQCIAEADRTGCTLILVHSHGPAAAVRLSGDDRQRAAEVFPAASRILAGAPSGTVVIGDAVIDGRLWRDGHPGPSLGALVVPGTRLERWHARHEALPSSRGRLDRQNRALGPLSDGALGQATVAVLGCSGGGSHVFQQLLYAGTGTLIVVDGDIVEESNLSRLVGAVRSDVGITPKVEVMRRTAKAVDADTKVIAVSEDFPHPEAVDALKAADVIVSCGDTWSAREQINAFARRYHIPLVDIGIQIRTQDGVLASADGQILAVTPDTSCLRCSLVTDTRLATERKERPPGYDLNPEAADPQVVSMNGTLASEAVNAVLDLLTGYAGGRHATGWWQYNGRSGTLDRRDLPPPRPGCPGCAEAGLGDCR